MNADGEVDPDRGRDSGAPPTAVTGPHAGYDKYGRLQYRYWRCERCGLESVDPELRDGCWRCAPRSAEGDDAG